MKTLRDEIAIEAMKVLLVGSTFPSKADRDEVLPTLATVCYEVADAMIAAGTRR